MRPRIVLATLAVAATSAVAGIAHGAQAPAIFTLAGADRGGFRGDGKAATDASLNGPAGLASAPDGSILVADTINQRIRRISPAGVITTVAGTGRRGAAGDGGPPGAAQFQDPTAIEATRAGVVVADTANSQVRLVGATVRRLAGTGESGFSGDGGPAVSAQLNEPSGIAVLGDTIFVADSGNNRVRAIDAQGVIRTVAGTGAAGFSGDGGPATSARLDRPAGLAISAGGLLIADSGNNRIRLVRADGTISTVAGTGSASSGGDGGRAGAAALNRPLDVAARGSEVFVAETGGNRVRRIDADGVISRLAGAGGPRFGGDGASPARALLNAPRAVEAPEGSTDVLIADTDNNRVRYVAVPGNARRLAIAPAKTSVLAPLVKVKRKRVVRDVPLAYRLSAGAPVTITIAVKRCGCRVAVLRRPGGPGLNAVSLPKALRQGKRRLTKNVYAVTLAARDSDGRVARNRMELIVR